jgi:hypothetical protein
VGDADSYKFSHAGAYPGGMTRALSYVEDRVGAKFPASLAFGFQYYLKRCWIRRSPSSRALSSPSNSQGVMTL